MITARKEKEMGDTCTLRIKIRSEDLEAFNKLLGDQWYTDDYSDSDDFILANVEEADYGWPYKLDTLADAKLTFYGERDNGATYQAQKFACFEGDLSTVASDTKGNIMVFANNDGTPEDGETQRVKDYFRVLSLIYKSWGEDCCPGCHTAYLVDGNGTIYCPVCG